MLQPTREEFINRMVEKRENQIMTQVKLVQVKVFSIEDL